MHRVDDLVELGTFGAEASGWRGRGTEERRHIRHDVPPALLIQILSVDQEEITALQILPILKEMDFASFGACYPKGTFGIQTDSADVRKPESVGLFATMNRTTQLYAIKYSISTPPASDAST